MLRLGFLASNAGSAMRAILRAIATGELAAEAALLVTNNPNAAALETARAHGLEALCLRTVKDPGAADRALAEAMTAAGVGLIILSGYLRRLGPATLAAYQGRILNIHPGPLPAFGGEGMYGRRVHEAVIASGAAQSGVCVHVVDEVYDHGPVVSRLSIPVQPTDSPEDLERRVTAAEPGFFVDTLKAIVEGRLTLPGLQTAAQRAKSAT